MNSKHRTKQVFDNIPRSLVYDAKPYFIDKKIRKINHSNNQKKENRCSYFFHSRKNI